MVKSTLTETQLKRAKEIYEIANSKTGNDRRQFVMSLSDTEKEWYQKESNKERQKKFNKNPENKVALNMHRRDYISNKRKEEPEEYKKRNVKDVTNFRMREKAKKEEIQAKLNAIQVLTDAIKKMKAKKELNQLKLAKLVQEPTKPKTKRGRPVGSKNTPKRTLDLIPRPKKM